MATVKAFNSLRFAGKQHISAGSHALAPYKEGTSVVFKAGAPVILSSGLVVEAANPNDTGVLLGLAARDSENDTDNSPIQVNPAIPGLVFDGILGNSADDLRALAQTDVGLYAALIKDTTAGNLGWYLNATTASLTRPNNSRVKIVGLKDAVGTVNGRVYFTFTAEGEDNAGNAVPGTIYS